MAAQATKAYNSGDYQRAVDLYLSAWRTDPQPGYLWALARAEHLAGLLDQAMEHYKAFIANPGPEAARVPKATDYMADIVNGQVATKLRDIEYAMRTKDFTSAALLCRDALAVAPDRVDVLFKLALAEFGAEHWEEAEQALTVYLSRAPADAAERRSAEERLKLVQQKLGKAPPPLKATETKATETKVAQIKPAAADPLTVDGVAAQSAPGTWTAWAAISGGGALVAGGAVVLALLQDDLKAYNAAMAQKNAGGKVTGIALDQASTDASSLNQRIGVGVGLVATGALAAGVGAWLLVRAPAGKIAVTPTANGILLALRF